MPLKVILNVDPETGETDNLLWAEKEEPPPLVRPKIRPRPKDEPEKKKDEKPS